MTPQIDCLRKKSPVLRVSAHIYGDFQVHRWENMFIFQGKPRHVTPQINHLGRIEHCCEGFNTHLLCCLGHRWESMFIFSSKPRHVTPQIDCLRKTEPCSEGLKTHLWGLSKEIDGKMFIFCVNLGMLPLKSIVSEKRALF